MNEEMEVLKSVAQSLETVGIPYMITGSVALNFFTIPRMTRDIDIVVEVKPKDIHKIISAFQNNFYIDKEAVAHAISQAGMFNIIHNQWIIKIDFIIRKDSEYRILEFQRKRGVEIEGMKIWIVSPEDLVLSKLFWAREGGSEMQLKDVRNLLEMGNLDMEYIEKWVESLNLIELYQKVR